MSKELEQTVGFRREVFEEVDMMSNFEQRCKKEPDKVIKFLLECQSRQAKRIFDYSNKISVLEWEIEMTHKVVKKVTSQEVFEKFNSQIEKKKAKINVDN
tara:strand:- start:345 stop:644 length:300 start_codon:yes stop_codon:yes gene_type:complete